MYHTNTVKNFEESTTKTLSIVRVIKFCKTKQRALALSHSWTVLLNPMTSYRKVSVNIACLPPIASHVDCSTNGITLKDRYQKP